MKNLGGEWKVLRDEEKKRYKYGDNRPLMKKYASAGVKPAKNPDHSFKELLNKHVPVNVVEFPTINEPNRRRHSYFIGETDTKEARARRRAIREANKKRLDEATGEDLS